MASEPPAAAHPSPADVAPTPYAPPSSYPAAPRYPAPPTFPASSGYAGAMPYAGVSYGVAQPWGPPAPAPADRGPKDPMHWVLPVGRSWQSVLAGYLGLLSLAIWVLAPFSIGFGIWALVRARSGGHGTGRAITGIVGGVLGGVIGIAFLIAT